MADFREARDSIPDVTELHPRFGRGLEDLAAAQERIYGALLRLLGDAPISGLFRTDVLMWSIGNRALEVADGFTATFRRFNLHAAGSLVRLQIDNVVRLSLLHHHGPLDDVEEALLAGEPLHHVADPTKPTDAKARLSDTRLVELARAHHPWLETVYQQSSRWVHLSDLHHGTSFQFDDLGGLTGSVPIRPEHYPSDLLVDVLWASKAACEAVASYIELGGMTRAAPEVAA